MRNRLSVGALVIFTMAFFSVRANAVVVVYPDRALFEAAAPGDTTIDFGTLTGGQDYASYPTGSGPTVSGVSFATDPNLPDSTKPQILFALAPSTKYNAIAEGLLASESQYSDARAMDLQIALPTGVKSLGFDYGSGFTQLSVHLSDGESFPLVDPTYPNLSFIGFTSTADITSVTLDSTAANNIVIGNFEFNAPAPEPGSLSLLGLGALGLLARRRV